MNIVDLIKRDSIVYRKLASRPEADLKVKTTSTLLVTLLGEVTMVGKNAGNRDTTDEEAIRVVRKFVSNIEDTLSGAGDKLTEEAKEKLSIERSSLEGYLPQMVSEDELKAFIDSETGKLVEKNMKQMGAIMKVIKEKYGSTFDAALASSYIKSKLS